MIPYRGSAGSGAFFSFVLKALLGLAACGFCTVHASTYTWSNTGGSAWTTTTNWSGVSGTYPGPSDIAEFDANPTGSTASAGVGVNYKNGVNNGTFSGASGTLGDQAVGAISMTSTRTVSLFIGNTQALDATHPGGYMTLNGATVGGIASTILSNASAAGILTIQNEVSSSNNGSNTFGLVLGNLSNVVQVAAGTSSAAGSLITITSNIDQASSGSSITLMGGGTASVLGGTLELGGTNSFTGGMTVGSSSGGGTQGGTLQIDAAYSISGTGSILVNNNSQILFPNSGTYGGLGQTLTLNGQGIASASSSNVSGALRASASVIWQGNLTLGSDSYITPTGSHVLTLSGTFTDNAHQLQKQGSGTLILSNAGNNMTGSTNIGNGTLTINAGSSMGIGNLQMAQTSTNNTALNLNNAAQTIGNLSSSFSATSGTTAGTYTQVITLGSSTALTINESGTTTFGNALVSSTVSQTSTITGGGSVTLGAASTGALTLTGTQTYTGGTQIKAGTLFADGSLSGTVNVQGGELGGSGAIAGLVTGSNGGIITAGSAASTIGELTLQSGLNLSNGGNYTWDLASDTDNLSGTAGTSFDQLEVTGGALTLGGSSSLTLDFLAGVNASDSFWNSNHSWTIISALGGSSVFGSITDPSYDGGTFSTADTSGQVTLNYQAGAVPEPSTVVAIGMGAALLLASRRRRR
jgi:autotransporter-associated beta strand protein